MNKNNFSIFFIRKNVIIFQKSIINEYKNKYGKYPESLDDLIQHKMLQISPELEEQFIIMINKNTGSVEVESKTK